MTGAGASSAYTRGDFTVVQGYLEHFDGLDPTEVDRLDPKALGGFASAH